MFHFFSTLWYALMHPVLCNIVDIVCCGLYHTKGNLGSLINHVSACIGKVIMIKKTAKLLLLSSVCAFLINSFFWTVFFFLFVVSFLNFNVLTRWQEIPRAVLFISTVSSKDLLNISIHKRCVSLQKSLILSPRNAASCNESFWILWQ